MSDQEVAKEAPVEEAAPTRSLMFVLEDVAVDAQETMFASLKKLLKEREVELTQALFSAHFAAGRIENNVPRLLRAVGRERLSAEKLVSEINETIPEAVLNADARSGVSALLSQVREAGVAVGAVSVMGDEQTAALVEKLGLTDLLDGVVSCGNAGPHLPAPDTWWRLAKAISVRPIRSLAVCSTSAAMRAALKTGARAVVLETPYTSCQDFGGADYVVDTFKDLRSVVAEWLDTKG